MVLKISGEGETFSLNDAEKQGVFYLGGRANIRFFPYSIHESAYTNWRPNSRNQSL